MKIGFLVMAATNYHTFKIYTCDNFLNAFILLIAHENIGIDTIFVTLPCILA